jgi:uncharacterized protein (DUF1501 family)
VLPDSRSLPTGGANNWSAGFLPARHQGVVLNTSGPPVRDLQPATPLDADTQSARFEAVAELNRRHLAEHAGDDALATRMRSYELAARMQLAIPDAADLARESAATLETYGVNRRESADFARSCLLARRLIERGVRFVQLWSGAAFGSEVHWDAHGSVPDNHRRESAKIDQPVAALLRDLRQRGLMDDTLVVWGGEFGRTPMNEARNGSLFLGRDHHPRAFTMWVAGGGVKPGVIGETDELGYNIARDPVDVHDLHASLLHQLGIDHEKLTYKFQGRDFRLTDVSGKLVPGLIG